MKKIEMITVRLEPPVAARIREQAAREHRSIAGQVRHLLAQATAELRPQAA
jgi:hypothetical protein